MDELAALNNSGIGGLLTHQSNISGYSNPTYQAPKPSFLSSVGHTLGSVGGAVIGAIDAPIHAVQNYAEGFQHNTQINQHVANMQSAYSNLEKQDLANTQAWKSGKIDTATYHATNAKLSQAYQALGKTQKTQVKQVESDVKTKGYTKGQAAKDIATVGGTALAVAAPFVAPIATGAGAADLTATSLAATRAGMTGAELGAGTTGAEAVGSRAAQVAMQASRGVAKGINAATGAGTAPTSSLLGGAAKIVGRNTAFIQPTIQTAGQTASDAAHGDVAGALGNAALLAAPAGISAVGKGIAKAAPGMHEAMYGRAGFFKAIAKAGGPDMLAHLESLPPKARQALEGTLRKVQQYNLDQTNGNAVQSAREFVAHFENAGRNIADLKPEQLSKELKSWVAANESVANKYKNGRLFFGEDGKPIVLKDNQRVIAARYNVHDHAQLMGLLKAAPDQAGRMQVIADQIKAGADWSKNPNVRSIIEGAVSKGDNYAKDINKIVRTPSLFTAGTKNVHLGNGYFAAVADNTRAGFKTLGNTAALDYGKDASGLRGKVGAALTKMGLSTLPTDNGLIAKTIKTNFAKNLQDAGIEGDAKQIYSSLASVSKPGVNDGRFLTNREVAGALVGIADNARPQDVLKALRDAHAQLPNSLVGLGPAKLNQVLAKAPGLSKYIRVEQAGRYDSGPLSAAFRVKQAIKGAAVAKAEGSQFGVRASKEEIQSLRSAGLVTKGASGNDQGLSSTMNFGEKGAKLMPYEQERIIGNLAASLARAHGTSVDALIADKTELGKQFRNSLDLVHGYGHGGYLNSPMAKTLNLVIFPSRFESKIVLEASKAVSKLPAAGQIGLASGIAHLTGFLNSPEGKKWQQENADAIGLVKAFTPLQTVENVANFVTKGGHFGDLGELGGLPVGVLGTILDHQGVNLGKLGTSQYMDPKTGEPVPNKIPQTVKARTQQAITDLIGSMFSYPGRTAGLNSKTNVIQSYVPGLKINPKDVKSELKDGTVVAPKSTSKKPTFAPVTINRGTVAAPKPMSIVPKYTVPKAPKRKIYGVRPKVTN